MVLFGRHRLYKVSKYGKISFLMQYHIKHFVEADNIAVSLWFCRILSVPRDDKPYINDALISREIIDSLYNYWRPALDNQSTIKNTWGDIKSSVKNKGNLQLVCETRRGPSIADIIISKCRATILVEYMQRRHRQWRYFIVVRWKNDWNNK